jgi:hypothetical protein
MSLAASIACKNRVELVASYRRAQTVVFAPAELVGVAQPGRTRIAGAARGLKVSAEPAASSGGQDRQACALDGVRAVSQI